MTLLEALREGGYILYIRHGEATVGQDQPNLNLQNCTTQRNLSDLGRQQAIYYGQLLQSLRIPICYPIITGPLCRTIETAQLAFGKLNIQIDLFWFDINRLSENLSMEERNKILGTLQSFLERKPQPGCNKVIISHGFPEGIGLGTIPDMGTVIIRPLEQGKGYEVIGKLSLEDLTNLLK